MNKIETYWLIKQLIFRQFVIAILLLGTFSPSAAQGQKDKFTLMVFMAEECPICQYHSLDLRELYQQHHAENIKFQLVFSNTLSKRKSMRDFKLKYLLAYQTKRDNKLKIAQKYGVTTTPEVVLLKNKKEIVYRGKISNAFAAVGVRRRVVNEFYLKEALEQVLAGEKVTIKETEPVGCLITLPKK